MCMMRPLDWSLKNGQTEGQTDVKSEKVMPSLSHIGNSQLTQSLMKIMHLFFSSLRTKSFFLKIICKIIWNDQKVPLVTSTLPELLFVILKLLILYQKKLSIHRITPSQKKYFVSCSLNLSQLVFSGNSTT